MPRPSVRLAIAAVCALAAALVLFPRWAASPHNDFVEYWAAGRLNLGGENPYDPARMLEVEQQVGWRVSYPMMMWNPPWTLTAVMPLGALPFPLARGVFLLVQLATALGCGIALWRVYAGPPAYEPWAVGITLLFTPLLLSLRYGQIGGLGLLGLTGFLIAQHRRRDFLAGAFLTLAAFKPHLVYAVWPAVLVWAVADRRWRVLLGAVTVGGAMAALPPTANPAVYAQFWQITAHPPPSGEQFKNITDWGSPTFGWLLRRAFGAEHFRLQYVPTALGLVWLGWYLGRHLRRWDWAERLPPLLLVSVATAAYGAWPADSLVLLPAVMATAARLAAVGRWPLIRRAGLAFFGLGLLTLWIENGPDTEAYVWVPPLWAAAYWWCRRATGGVGAA